MSEPYNTSRWKHQTTFYDPTDTSNPNKGNCGEAAIASLLWVPIPSKWGVSGNAEDYWTEREQFCLLHGFYPHLMPSGFTFPGYYLASGPSPRGCSHVVVMLDGHLAHDPHPSGEGLLSIEHVWVLLPIDPIPNTL